MCNFLSAIVHRSRGIICDPEHTDSHSDLIAAHLPAEKDNHAPGTQPFVRVEFWPDDNEWGDPDAYKLHLDETSRPDWYDEAKEFEVAEELRDRIRAMIVDDKRAVVLGGCWIVVGSGEIGRSISARIAFMLDSSQVGEMLDSSQVGEMLDSSQVRTMLDSSQVRTMLGSSQVGEMRGSSQVRTMRDSSQVGEMLGSSQVGEMRDSSQVRTMLGSSQVGEMRGPNQIRHAFATRMRASSGIDIVQVLMGHRHRSTTEIYAKPDALAAIDAIMRFG